MRCWSMGLGLLLGCGLVITGCSTPEAPSDGGVPPVVPSGPGSLIVVDVAGLRADRLGSYGYPEATSPEMDQLAADAVRFEWAFGQAPGTAAAVASLMTGIYPSSLRMGVGEDRLAEGARTLPELLTAEGMGTAVFLDGGSLTCEAGFGQGFSRCDDSGQGVAEVGEKAVAWLRESSSSRFLLWVHLADPLLGPGSAELPDDPGLVGARYDGAIHSVDAWVGALKQELGTLGLLEKSVVVLVGSHGVSFGEHGPLLGDGLYSPITRIPFLMRFPGGEHGGTVVSKIVEAVDLVPTLLELAEAEVPEGMQGGSLVSLVQGSGTPPYVAFGESPARGGERYAALGGYRLILNKESGASQLFHTAMDPLEQTDLAEAEADRVAVLQDHLEAWEALVAASEFGAPPAEASLDEAELEKLRTLGYIQ